jgi:hypothetical protein
VHRVVHAPAHLALCLRDSTSRIMTSLSVSCSSTATAWQPCWYFLQIPRFSFATQSSLTTHRNRNQRLSQTSIPSKVHRIFLFGTLGVLSLSICIARHGTKTGSSVFQVHVSRHPSPYFGRFVLSMYIIAAFMHGVLDKLAPYATTTERRQCNPSRNLLLAGGICS